MVDYTPTHVPGHAVTFTASAAVTGGRLVEVSGDWTVAHAAAGSQKVVGTAGHDAAVGAQVTVHCPGRPIAEANTTAAVAAGDHLKASATGVVPFVGTDPEPARVGLALAAAAIGAPCSYQTA